MAYQGVTAINLKRGIVPEPLQISDNLNANDHPVTENIDKLIIKFKKEFENEINNIDGINKVKDSNNISDITQLLNYINNLLYDLLNSDSNNNIENDSVDYKLIQKYFTSKNALAIRFYEFLKERFCPEILKNLPCYFRNYRDDIREVIITQLSTNAKLNVSYHFKKDF